MQRLGYTDFEQRYTPKVVTSFPKIFSIRIQRLIIVLLLNYCLMAFDSSQILLLFNKEKKNFNKLVPQLDFICYQRI